MYVSLCFDLGLCRTLYIYVKYVSVYKHMPVPFFSFLTLLFFVKSQGNH